MHRKRPISEVHEMYLKTLLQVRGSHEVARVGDLAEGLGVSPGTVSSVVKKLIRLHLVDHDRYGFVALTPQGYELAACVVRRYETLRDTLVEVFGVDAETAAEDACMMEHAASPATVNRMRELLSRVRSRRVSLGKTRSRARRDEPCSRCEELGSCQAAAGRDE